MNDIKTHNGNPTVKLPSDHGVGRVKLNQGAYLRCIDQGPVCTSFAGLATCLALQNNLEMYAAWLVAWLGFTVIILYQMRVLADPMGALHQNMVLCIRDWSGKKTLHCRVNGQELAVNKDQFYQYISEEELYVYLSLSFLEPVEIHCYTEE